MHCMSNHPISAAFVDECAKIISLKKRLLERNHDQTGWLSFENGMYNIYYKTFQVHNPEYVTTYAINAPFLFSNSNHSTSAIDNNGYRLNSAKHKM